jgi:hypothetical protein
VSRAPSNAAATEAAISYATVPPPPPSPAVQPAPAVQAAAEAAQLLPAQEPQVPGPALAKDAFTEPKAEITQAAASDLTTPHKPPEDPPPVAALRCFLDKRPEDATDCLKNADKTNQELLLCILPLAARLNEGKLSQLPPEEVDALVQELTGLTVPLRARAPLVIVKSGFCESIKTFGVYQPWPDSHRFRHGDRVQIYVELRNFASKEQKLPSGEVRHVVQLVSSAEIRDYANKVVAKIDFQRDGPDESRTLRHDYFDTYSFWVSDNVQPGSYTLWITVEDRGTVPPRRAKQSLDFHVANLSVQGS